MANYYVDENGNITKKKKSKYSVGYDGKLTINEEDIAPVRSDRGKADLFGLDFVQSGALDDGYQLFDVTKSILGTAGDLGLEVVKGAGGLVEGVTDLLGYAGAGVADLFGADDFAEDWRTSVKRNTVNDLTQGADDYLEKYSFAGNTLDAVGQGVGQVGTIILTGGAAGAAGLGTLGTTALTTGLMGVSGVGSGMSEAYEAGASDGDAFTYGLISGAADAFTELIFGGLGKSVNALGFGRGLTSADDMLAKTLSNKFKSTVAKNFVEFGVKASAEGIEEVLAGTLQAIGKKATYMSEEDLGKIIEDENLFEQFVVGAMTSGIAQAGSVKTANKTGRDFITGLTQNEQTVVDSLYESEIAGKDLSKKEKQKIHDQILTKLDKGYISTDDIESVLGGESYKTYKDTLDSETALKDKLTALQKEYEEIKKTHWRERTEEQFDRMAELETEIKTLEAQVNETTANSKLKEMKSQLSKSVYNLTKNDTKLQESYREIARRQQDLDLDVEQYKGAAKITAQNLLKGGMNNTNRVHDVVDLLTKISADKNIVFDVATAQKLAEAGLAVNGKQVNGLITKDGIVLNLESSAVLETTVGHEITHTLEGTEHYEVLKNAIKEYAELKGVYADKYNSAVNAYAKKDAKGNILKDANGNTVWIRDDVDIDSEIIADLVGEYVFTDADFINNLSVQHRNVFQKIYDEIKYLVKIATAGSEEARKLEEVKMAFDKAYKEDISPEALEFSDTYTKYSIRDEAPPKKVIEGYKVFVVKDGKLYPPMVANPDGEGTPIGVWLNADVGGLSYDENGDVQLNDRGRFKVKAGGKGTQGGGGELAFRPGWHLGEYPDASQFGRENAEKLVKNKKGKMVHPKELFPYNFVWARCEVAADHDYQLDAMSFGVNENGKFERSQAGLPYIPEDGYYKYRTNADPDTAPWIISGAIKVVEILDDDQVAKICAEHGVTPQQRQGYSTDTKEDWLDAKTLRAELKAAGIDIPKGAKTADLRKLYSENFLNGEIPTKVSGYSAEARPGGKIDLSMFGLNAGQVTPTSEDVLNQIRQTETTAADRRAKAEDLLKTLPGYAKRKINFDDANIIKEFGMNNQSVDEYRAMAEASGHGYLTDEKIYSEPVKYSLTEDSNGNKLSPAVQNRFAKSKVVDENGNLKVVYHGTASGEFFVFDKAKGSVEGDFGSGFYFTDNADDVSRNYEGGGPDFENKIDRRAEQIEAEEDISYAKARKRAIEELYKGSHKFEVYLNIENPAVVGETTLFDPDTYLGQYNEEDYDSYEDYEGDVEQLIADDIDQILWDIERNVDVYSTDGLAEVLWNAVNEGGIGIEDLKKQINELYLEDSNGNLVGNEVARQIIESLGYDGIIDPTVSGKWNMDMEEGTTHYIVFKPNQIKSITNENPTDNPDIRYSLSDDSKTIVNKLTGEEISENTYTVLSKLERGENVPLSELEALKEVQEGKLKAVDFRDDFIAQHHELKVFPAEEVGTHLIDTPEREQLRKDILQKRLTQGSFTGIDKNGDEVYNGSVEKGKRLDIIIGLPASGKSSAIVNPLSEFYKAVVIDSDIIKKELPEYNDGWGASLVHEESSVINQTLFNETTRTGNNIVLPIVGAKTSSVERYIDIAKAQGYSVYLHLNELPSSKAMGRMLGRYFNTGRFIDPAIAAKYGNKPTEVYETMKGRGDISGYSRWNNDVARGQRPTHTEISGGIEVYGAYSDSWGTGSRSGSKSVLGENSQRTNANLGDGVEGLRSGLETDAPRRKYSLGSTGTSEVVRLTTKTEEALTKSGVVSFELIDSSNDSNAFSIALDAARKADAKNGWAVTPKKADELVNNNIRTIMSADRMAGLGIATDGDIEAVFKNRNGGPAKALDTLIPAALEAGGNKLDCYGAGLARLYSQYGFVPVARVEFVAEFANEGWTEEKGTPDIFFMVHNGDSADTVIANKGKYKWYTEEELKALPLFEGEDAYDDAYAYRDGKLTQSSYSLSDPNDIAPVDFQKSARYLMVDKSNAQDFGDIAPMTEAEANALQSEKTKMANAEPPVEEEPKKLTRSELHKQIIGKFKHTFQAGGFDFDEILRNAKNLSTFATVDNTPQRVMEKALGYKEGQILSDLTVNKVAQNETAGIKWLNSVTGRKNGMLAQLSDQYKIKPGSKESAAAQMYAEGFYVDDNNDIIAYGDAELAKDFPDAQVQNRIKGLARDPRIRQFYDETLEMINQSRTRNAYPEIPRLENYFLHFRAMDDTFSKLGLPFNPNDIRAKDLPTDLNGVTADLKPGQPYFASAMHRNGKRTSFDLLGGLERYASSAKNQIYHIDDIQNLRALRNYIADNFGQAHGLENIDTMSEEEAQQRIEEVFSSHLSTFAKFLNEEANALAGKTSLIDRSAEGIIGRRMFTFMDTLNKQVGSNMVGYNVSSALTNFDAVVRGFAKTNKFDFLKAFTQYTSNKIGSAFGKGDGFAENNPTIIRRNGADRFYRTPWQKVGDAGYGLMGVVDNISTELIVRAKYNELTRKGMSEQQAVIETDKWVSRLMGDRSLGQQPLLFNSKTLGLITKFQLEVRNNLDSMFYDTIQEAKVSNEDIVNAKERSAKTAAKITSTLVQTAVATHLFGKAFESIAGYNPTFDIVSVLATLFGFDDEEESEDTALDNMEQAFLELLEDLPYTSTLTGGRIPIGSALPIKQFITGKDQYGNEKSRWETITEAAPYYLLPGGYGQIKKTTQGLGMFSDDLPIAGSYTDSGNLRFPVEDTPLNRLQAGIFGQYASANARDYFDNNRTALKEKQIQEFIDVDIPIRDYWEYREGLSDQKTIEDKFDYIAGLDLPVSKKNILINNIVDREEKVDLEGYEDFSSYEEFDFATKNPEKYTVAKAVGGYNSYATHYKAMNDISADKDASGKSITGSRKEKIIAYVNSLNIDYGMKIILFKSEYKADDTYNYDILNYLNSRNDLTYDEIVTILTELDFTVDAQGNVYWD